MNTLPLEYERDFPGWINQHIAWLKAGQFHQLDIDPLIEELEGMAHRDRNELVSHLVILIAHLLSGNFNSNSLRKLGNTPVNMRLKVGSIPLLSNVIVLKTNWKTIPV